MTPQEQIAYLRSWLPACPLETQGAIAAVCDLAERALLTDDEAGAVRRWFASPQYAKVDSTIDSLLRRLLPEERAEHRLASFTKFTDNRGEFRCSCGWAMTDAPDAAVRAWAAHAGIGGTVVPADQIRIADAVLRRLLPDERDEHRLDLERAYLDAVYETCAAREEHMASVLADDYHEKWRAWTDAQHRESVALRALWAAHAGIGGTE